MQCQKVSRVAQTVKWFYEFVDIEHDPSWGEFCHPNCDCGRFMEIGNSVFMEYVKRENGFERLPKQNVDFGGGLERIAAAKINSPDVFQISVLKPIIDSLEEQSGTSYQEHTASMRVIADHVRAAVFLAVDGISPSNKEQGYVMRRLLRRAIRFAFDLDIDQDLMSKIVPLITELYATDFPEVAAKKGDVVELLVKEEKVFRQTLKKGLKVFDTLTESNDKKSLSGATVFQLYDTFGFPWS